MPDLYDVTGSGSDFGAVAEPSTPAEPATQFSEAEDGSLAWGDVPEETEENPDSGDASIGGDQDLANILAGLDGGDIQHQPQRQQPQNQLPPADQMPEEFDSRLLDRGTVELYRQQISLYYDQQLTQLGANGQHPAVQQAYQAAKAATLSALDFKAKLTSALGIAYQAYQKNVELEKNLEPSRRVELANLLAKRFNTTPERLLTHPRTKQPINDPRIMLAIASVIGEEDRTARVSARKGVDNPVRPAASAGRGRSIQSLDPHGKEFEALERAVASGKVVRLFG